MIRWILATLFALAVGTGIHLYKHLGMALDAEIVGEQAASFEFLLKSHLGPYQEINQTISEVEAWAFKNGLSCKKTFGIYIDDPGKVDEDRLRSEGGCLLEANEKSQLNLPKGFSVKIAEQKKYLALTFSGSPAISPLKVYPKADQWFATNHKQKKGPVLEVYESTGGPTHYFFEIL